MKFIYNHETGLPIGLLESAVLKMKRKINILNRIDIKITNRIAWGQPIFILLNKCQAVTSFCFLGE